MDPKIKDALFHAVQTEPFARQLKMELIELEDGHSKVEMVYLPDEMSNIHQRVHGGAVFALIDEAFETACHTDGTIAVALNVNVTYIASPEPGVKLIASAQEISRTKRTANFEIKVTDENKKLIATCQALAFRTGKPIPFL